MLLEWLPCAGSRPVPPSVEGISWASRRTVRARVGADHGTLRSMRREAPRDVAGARSPTSRRRPGLHQLFTFVLGLSGLLPAVVRSTRICRPWKPPALLPSRYTSRPHEGFIALAIAPKGRPFWGMTISAGSRPEAAPTRLRGPSKRLRRLRGSFLSPLRCERPPAQRLQ